MYAKARPLPANRAQIGPPARQRILFGGSLLVRVKSSPPTRRTRKNKLTFGPGGTQKQRVLASLGGFRGETGRAINPDPYSTGHRVSGGKCTFVSEL